MIDSIYKLKFIIRKAINLIVLLIIEELKIIHLLYI